MGSKINPGQHDCHAAALPDEPMFTLLARDPVAPDLVRRWASARGLTASTDDFAKLNEARVCAGAMEIWRRENWPMRKGEKIEPTTVDAAYHDARVSELLQVNNREVERRRSAERRIDELERSVAVLMRGEQDGPKVFDLTPICASNAEAEA